MNLLKSIAVIGKTAKKCAPTILSVAGAAGVAVTGIAAAKAGYEDARNDVEQNEKPHQEAGEKKIKRKIKTYAKPVIFGVASMGCILAGDRLHAKRYMALGAAAGIIQEKYDRLRGYLGTCNSYIENGDKRVDYTKPGETEHMTRAASNFLTAEDVYAKCREQGIEPEDTHSGTDLWYEPESKTFFLASEGHIERAFSNLNRIYKAKEEASLMELYRFLEISASEKPGYDLFLWNSIDDEVYYQPYAERDREWIEVVYLKKMLPNGQKYTQIFYPIPPHLSQK